MRCVLDSGGLTALCGRSTSADEALDWLTYHDGEIIVPTPILVECTTGDGARDAEVNRVMDVLERMGARISAPDEKTARRAGALRYRAKTDDGIDALVAAVAVGDGTPAVVLTSDPRDLRKLLARNKHVAVRRV